MSAAEEPRPVLATSASATAVGLKGESCVSEAMSAGKPRLLSCKIGTEADGQSGLQTLSEKVDTVPGPVESKSRYLQQL